MYFKLIGTLSHFLVCPGVLVFYDITHVDDREFDVDCWL
jgi:hypothetical protein